MHMQLAALRIDAAHRPSNVLHMLVEQIAFTAYDMVTINSVMIKRQVQPAGHIGMLAGAFDQRDSGVMWLQVTRQEIGNDGAADSAAYNQNMLGHNSASFSISMSLARHEAGVSLLRKRTDKFVSGFLYPGREIFSGTRTAGQPSQHATHCHGLHRAERR